MNWKHFLNGVLKSDDSTGTGKHIRIASGHSWLSSGPKRNCDFKECTYMIPQPQGFACVVEPVDRARIDDLVEKLKAMPTTFGVNKTIPGYDIPCLLRVVAAGPGVGYEDGFIKNHIHVGDHLLGTITEMDFAKDSLDPKGHWTFDDKHYIVMNTRDYHDITGSALFVVSREPEVPEF